MSDAPRRRKPRPGGAAVTHRSFAPPRPPSVGPDPLPLGPPGTPVEPLGPGPAPADPGAREALDALDALVLGDRARREPADSPAPDAGPARDGLPPLVGVVAGAAALSAALGGVAAELRADGDAPVVVVAAPGLDGRSVPPMPRAAALARRLRSRGFAADAAGALCRVPLTADAAWAEARRLAVDAGAAGAAVVVGVSDRCAEAEAFLGTADRLVLALPGSASAALASLAADSLQRLGPPLVQRRIPADPVGRSAAGLGLRGLTPAPDRALEGDAVACDASPRAVEGSR